jgi:chaperonin cofactor prefoldin
MNTQGERSLQAPSACCDIVPTISERLTTKKRQLEEELREINHALKALTDNPELQGIFDAVSKVRFY